MTRHVIPISGKDSLATALVQTVRQPDLPYEFFFNDVHAELPETYEWLDKVESVTGWKLKRIGKSLPERIREYGGFLPGPRSRYCTRECKIEPMEAYLGKEETCIYYGLRADFVRTGYIPLGKSNIKPIYPLQEMGIDLQGVYSIVSVKGLQPPEFFWQRMYEAVKKRMPDNWESAIPHWRKLFSGRSRANCFSCFFQRQYEFLWLMETHPDLFAEASAMEKDEYTFQPGFRLASLYEEKKAKQVFDDRVKEIIRMIGRSLQGNLFGGEDNEIAHTSCGLLCGK